MSKDDEKKKKEEEEKKAAAEAAEKKELSDTLKTLATGMTALSTGFGELKESLVKKKEDDDDDDSKSTFDDLETLDRRGFLDVIIKEVSKVVKTEVAPVQTQVASLGEDANVTERRRQIAEVVHEHPDFWEWRDEIGAIAKENDTLSMQEYYTLARASDKEKAEKMDKKYYDKGDEKDEKKVKEPAFGGLTPTSGEIPEAERAKNKDDASEKAWQKVMGSSGEAEVGK